MTVDIGDLAPDFRLPAGHGREVRLSDYRGTNVVVYFYPKDQTPGCTKEAKEFAEHYEAFRKANTEILGISRDSLSSHEKFRTKYHLPFMLLSDAGENVCESYGALREKRIFGRSQVGIQRMTYLIGADGRVHQVWPKVRVTGHVKNVLAAAQDLHAAQDHTLDYDTIRSASQPNMS